MLKYRYFITIVLLFAWNIELLKDNNINSDEDNYLSIPKINLKRTIYDIGNIANDVNQNIELLKDNPNNFILAGHNGDTDIAYFKNLDKLEIGDLIYFNYHGTLHIYELKKIYEINKNGYFKVDNYLIPVITLITCKKYSNNLQLVYIGYFLK